MHVLLTAIRRLSGLVNTLTEGALMLCAVGMVAVISLQVFCRYVLNDSLFWSEELGRMLLVWLTFLGACVAYKRGAHIGVDILTERLSGHPRRAAHILAHLVALAFFAVLITSGMRVLDFMQYQQTAALGITKQIPFSVVPLSGAVLFLHGVAFVLEDLFGGGKA
ncbi:TRAP transporter small permease [Desulfobaculum senezii]